MTLVESSSREISSYVSVSEFAFIVVVVPPFDDGDPVTMKWKNRC